MSSIRETRQHVDLESAACRHTPEPDIFFSFTPEDTRRALAICFSCPILEECRQTVLQEDAATNPRNIWGVQGGLDEDDRRALRRAQVLHDQWAHERATDTTRENQP